MSKGLDALNRLYVGGSLDIPYVINGQQHKDLMTVEKELKALEIIKNKKVDVWAFSSDCETLTYEETYECMLISLLSKEKLTKQEYDLLKEVLL